jgi:Flp pilus assembly pilin Flp
MLKYFVAAQNAVSNSFDNLRSREEGQTMAEYGVVLAVITGGIMIALLALSGAISGALNAVTGRLG